MPTAPAHRNVGGILPSTTPYSGRGSRRRNHDPGTLRPRRTADTLESTRAQSATTDRRLETDVSFPSPSPIHQPAPHAAAPGAMTQQPPAVAGDRLVKTYGTGDALVSAVADVSAAFGVGEFTAIMGPSGSGKSTLMHLLAGLDRPTSGEVFVEGSPISGMRDRELTQLRRDRFGFIFQSFNLVPTLSAEENIVLPLQLANRKVDRDELQHLAAQLGIAERLTHLPHELSGGQQQRVAVARALITRPAVVFADEPTGALDLRTGRELLASLQAAAHQRRQTVIMVTHDPAAAAYADRVLILVDGRIAQQLDRPSYEQIVGVMAEVGA